jgi:hypothetical protein
MASQDKRIGRQKQTGQPPRQSGCCNTAKMQQAIVLGGPQHKLVAAPIIWSQNTGADDKGNEFERRTEPETVVDAAARGFDDVRVHASFRQRW